jgi:hypothetical protein
MTSQLEHARPVAVPPRIGQATAVEQSRAIAEVQAQVIVAQQMPRNVDTAVREVMRSCAQRSLAEKAFWRYPRGGQQLTGESIVLAKELARCWGNIQYGIAELRRDDDAGESEMMAFAWDVQTNARPSTTFIVPHVLDTTNGRKRLADVRDIYENNANMGSRRMREMILNVLPPWLVEDAKAACYATLAADDRDGKTLAERAATAAARFDTIGVRADQLVRKVGAPQARWSAGDLAQLAVIWRSLERGETTTEAEFGAVPSSSPTAAELTAQADATPARPRGARKAKEPADRPSGAPSASASEEGSASGAPAPAPDAPSENQPPDDPPASTGQVGKIQGHMRRLGYAGDEPEERDARLGVVARLARLPRLESTTDLSSSEAARVIRALDMISDRAQLDAMLATGEVAGGE